MGAGSLGADVGVGLVLDGGVLLGVGLRVLGGELLGEGLPVVGGAFVAEWVGPAEVVSCMVDRVIVLGAACADAASPVPLWRPLLPDPADTVLATGAK